jgi:hypothetical protein
MSFVSVWHQSGNVQSSREHQRTGASLCFIVRTISARLRRLWTAMHIYRSIQWWTYIYISVRLNELIRSFAWICDHWICCLMDSTHYCSKVFIEQGKYAAIGLSSACVGRRANKIHVNVTTYMRIIYVIPLYVYVCVCMCAKLERAKNFSSSPLLIGKNLENTSLSRTHSGDTVHIEQKSNKYSRCGAQCLLKKRLKR